MSTRRSTRVRTTLTSALSPPPPASSPRPRRAASGSNVKVTRDESNSPDDSKKALRLTMKMPSSKLREATSANSPPNSRGNPADQLKDSLTSSEMVSGPRASRANKKYVVESESDDESQEDEEDAQVSEGEEEEEDEDDQVGGPEESDDEGDEEEDAEADADLDVDADGDVDMEDEADDGQPPPTPQPVLKVKGPAKPAPKQTPSKPSKPTVTVTPAEADKVKSVEAKEMELDDDDEELSELSEDDEEDAEGDADEEMADDDESRGSTPDLSKMTKRQRSRLDQVVGADFLQLPMEPQIKKHLTAEEHAMRRAEMARRRKNLSEKRNEEEKMDTINRLLKKQAPKRRGKISAAEIQAQDQADDATHDQEQQDEEIEVQPANPLFVRWVSDKAGCRVGVPEEWLGQGVGRVFGGSGKMVEEVEG